MSNYTHDKTGITVDMSNRRKVTSECKDILIKWKYNPVGKYFTQENWSVKQFGVEGSLGYDGNVKMYRWSFRTEHFHVSSPKSHVVVKSALEYGSFNGTIIGIDNAFIECHAFIRSILYNLQRYKSERMQKCIYGVSSFGHDREEEA